MRTYSLFEVIGIELEYMIVHSDTLNVFPACDQLLKIASGGEEPVADLDFEALGWSNELVNHVVELKTLDPPRLDSLPTLGADFQEQVDRVNELLQPMGGRLMPGAMHPWMNPNKETQLWPYEYSAIYKCYNRVFNCRGHGWSNLQSMHINLPFLGDEEFGMLHAAVRFLMPVIPALTASSPVADGKVKNFVDFRLRTYQSNSARIPQVTGKVIPEPVFTKQQYYDEILRPLYHAISPFDPDDIMQEEWLNSRGAIARFDRGTIEIRILDIQECPLADTQIAMLLCAVLRMLTEETWCTLDTLKSWQVDPLFDVFTDVVEKGGDTVINNAHYLKCLGVKEDHITTQDLWGHLYKASGLTLPAVEHILEHGNLSKRILASLGGKATPASLKKTYGQMCDCLKNGTLFA